jgi:ATP-independent RNA helicase DbpA
MATIEILGGKKQKLRAGDILGALTSKKNNPVISGQDIGKINLMEQISYVAVHKAIARDALNAIVNGRMKGKQFRARLV